MRNRNPLAAWDTAVAAYLANRRALGRAYQNDEYSLTRLRRFLEQSDAPDLNEQLFNRWRASFYRASNRTRSSVRDYVQNRLLRKAEWSWYEVECRCRPKPFYRGPHHDREEA